MVRNIWRFDTASDPFTFSSLSNKRIAQLEASLNIQLPKEYLALLKIKNGGYLKYTAFPTKFETSWAEDHLIIDYLYGIGENDGISLSPQMADEWGLPKNLLFLSSNSHTWIALDYRNVVNNPEILYIDVEREEMYTLYKSFAEFLEKLTEINNASFLDNALNNNSSLEHIEKITSEDDLAEIFTVLYNQQSYSKTYLNLLSTYADHENEQIRETISMLLHSISETYGKKLDQKIVNSIIKKLSIHNTADVQYYLELIKSLNNR